MTSAAVIGAVKLLQESGEIDRMFDKLAVRYFTEWSDAATNEQAEAVRAKHLAALDLRVEFMKTEGIYDG